MLHHVFLRDGRKKEFCIKRVYPTDTYLLYSKGSLLIFAVIENSESDREPLEIGKQIIADAQEIMSTSFIVKHI